jgi:signal transduction histidine kinase
MLKFFTAKKKVETKIVIDPRHEKFFQKIYGDEKRYEQILLNFISNALKFTSNGGLVQIELEAKQVTQPNRKHSTNII